MKTSKKYWQMKSLTGVILVCIFLTACGGETQEAERKSNVQENETVSITTIEQTVAGDNAGSGRVCADRYYPGKFEGE